MLVIQHAGATSVGRVRKNNEDVFAIFPDIGVALVADGMGGAACGEIASGMAAAAVRDYFNITRGLTPAELVLGSIRFANDRVFQAAQSQSGCDGMGTTMVMAHWEGDHLWLGNVGDSRGYIFRRGAMHQLSYDQNLANELRHNLGLSEEQIATYPQRNALTMAIGTRPEVQPRLCEGKLMDGDTILLCSDGLTNPVTEDLIFAILSDSTPISVAADSLVNAALEGGGPDNVSVVLLRCQYRAF